MTNTILFFVTLTLGAACLPAQRTWVVDRNNGPGTDFTDLPPAVVAAAPGDVILVRPATGQWYHPPVVDKALSIFGDPTSGFDILGAMEVRHVPVNQTFTLANVRIGCTTLDPFIYPRCGMNAHDNAGVMHFDNVEYGIPPSTGTYGSNLLGFLIERCALATISHSRIYGSNVQITFRNSTVMATDSTFTGSHWAVIMIPEPKPHALFLQDSTVWLIDCTVVGTGGDQTYYPKPGITPCRSVIYIGGTTTVRGGNFYGGGPSPAIEIPISQTTNGCATPAPVVILDPRSVALGVASPPVIAHHVPVTALQWGLQGTTPRSVNTIQYTQPGSLTALVASAFLPTPLLGPLGPIALDPALLFVLDVGIADPAGQHPVSIRIPPNIVGPIELPLQAIELSPGGQLSFTNAIVPRQT